MSVGTVPTDINYPIQLSSLGLFLNFINFSFASDFIYPCSAATSTIVSKFDKLIFLTLASDNALTLFSMLYVNILTIPNTIAPASLNTFTTSITLPPVEIKSSTTTTLCPFIHRPSI